MLKFQLILLSIICLGCVSKARTQPDRWQQKIRYEMDIDFNVQNHRFTGKQKITYYNNSADVLDKVFYHLYFNAFQPGSMMDVRSRTISDPDRRVGDRISKLKPDEIGYHKILSLTQNGKPVKFEVVGTVLEVTLHTPIPAKGKATFQMQFESQVPLQIRRSGRMSAEGVDYSIAQWYPKMCEYDYQGWHANPYVGREFYGVWGDFDVKISIDKRYVIGGTGYLQNPEEVGHGYEKPGQKIKPAAGDKHTWHFKAPNVHDFMWAADPDYNHTTYTRKDGLVLHFFYLKTPEIQENWGKLPAIMDRAFDFINPTFGQYPYKQYSFIQGGDGGMEYPMATLITGGRNLNGLVGVAVHELMHSWYQMTLGSNESLYAWMDEGFTEYASTRIENWLAEQRVVPETAVENPFRQVYNGYITLYRSGKEEALSTHADHFATNYAYGRGSYGKGAVFLRQLEYILGKNNFDQGLLMYFNTWKFKHPNVNDVIRIFEKQSGLELDWYKEYWVNTTHAVDYAVEDIKPDGAQARIMLKKIGVMPMPLDVVVNYTDGSKKWFNIPLEMMRGHKPTSVNALIVLEDWPWTHPNYSFTLPVEPSDILSVEIDPTEGMADTDRSNNIFPKK